MATEMLTAEYLIELEKAAPEIDYEKRIKTGLLLPMDINLATDQYLLELQARGIKMDKQDLILQGFTFFLKHVGRYPQTPANQPKE